MLDFACPQRSVYIQDRGCCAANLQPFGTPVDPELIGFSISCAEAKTEVNLREDSVCSGGWR